MAVNKRDFGSFHSSNVQELLSLPENEYRSPRCPISLPELGVSDDNVFNVDVKQKYFLLERDCVFLNHGAFGGVLKVALEASQKWQLYAESQPLRFYDREIMPLLADITRKLAKFIDCRPLDLVLVRNATTALNAVIRSLKFQNGDIIFILSTTYGAVKKLVKQICLEQGAIIKEVEVPVPVEGNQQLIELIKKELDSLPNIKLAVFDHIPSNYPFILPIKDLVDLCHFRNIPVLVDGAHTLGNIELSINSISADFYVSNCHKWLCSPKGAAFLHVQPKYHDVIKPLVISHGFGSGFNSQFIWSGLQDYSPLLSLSTVLQFWHKVGIKKILHHNHSLVREAGKLLCDAWKTKLMAPENMFGSMVLVEVPFSVYKTNNPTYSEAEKLQNNLYHGYNIEVPIKVAGDKLCVRISAHMYNILSEYQKLADSVIEISKLSQ